MESKSSPISYITGVFTATFGSLTAQEFAIWVGIATTIGTFLVNWYYKAKEARRVRNEG